MTANVFARKTASPNVTAVDGLCMPMSPTSVIMQEGAGVGVASMPTAQRNKDKKQHIFPTLIGQDFTMFDRLRALGVPRVRVLYLSLDVCQIL